MKTKEGAKEGKELLYNIPQKYVKEVLIHEHYQFVEFIDIGGMRKAMMIEDKAYHQIKFVLLGIKPKVLKDHLKLDST